MDGDHNAVLEPDLVRRGLRDLAGQDGALGEEGPDIPKYHPGLFNRAGQDKNHAALAFGEAVLGEQRNEDRQGRGDPALSGSSPDHTPEFTHPPTRWRPVARDARKHGELLGGKIETERSLQHSDPRAPRIDRTEGRTKQLLIGKCAGNVDHVQSPSGGPENVGPEAVDCSRRTASTLHPTNSTHGRARRRSLVARYRA